MAFRPKEDFDTGSFYMRSNSKSRPSIGKRRRRIVFERDEHKCVYCGSDENLTIDHIHPVSKGGSNNVKNLQILCRDCNNEKADKII